jgi:hypothetical protein
MRPAQRKFSLVVVLLAFLFAVSLLGWIFFSANDLQVAANIAQLASVAIAVTPAIFYIARQWREMRRPASAAEIRETLEDLANRTRGDSLRELDALRIDNIIPVRWNLERVGRLSSSGTRTGHVEVDLMDHDRRVSPISPLTLTARSDSTEKLADDFRMLSKRRLVILGDPGWGKSLLAIKLSISLIDTRSSADPVPILLSLASWNLNDHPNLRTWLIAKLTERYRSVRASSHGSEIAETLIDQCKIIPILDGLDEVPDELRGQAITSINTYLKSEHAQLILTCRTNEFVRSLEGAREVIPQAAVIKPARLTRTELAADLRLSLPRTPDAEWNSFLAAVEGGTAPAVTNSLSVPLGIWLLKSVFVGGGSPRDPSGLLNPALYPDGNAIRSYLLRELVPALVERDQRRSKPLMSQPRDPVVVITYLDYLSKEMSRTSSTDIAWWRLARQTLNDWEVWIPLGTFLSAAVAAIAWFGFGNVWNAPLLDRGILPEISATLPGGLIDGVVVGLAAGIALWLSFDDSGSRWLEMTPDPIEQKVRQLVNNRLVGGPGLGLLFGAVVGAAVGISRGSQLGLTFGLGGGLTFGLASGLTFGVAGELTFRLANWASRRSLSSTPESTLRADRWLCCASTGVVFVGFASSLGLVVGILVAATNFMAGGLVGRRSQAWAIYSIAVLKLASSHRLPRRLMPFLSDCNSLGILRTSGPRFQFRHAALQEFLASR